MALAAVERVITSVSPQFIAAFIAKQMIVVLLAVELVVAYATVKHVLTNATMQVIVSVSANEVVARHGCRASVHLRMGGENPAQPQCDDLFAANRLSEALLAALTNPGVIVFADTLADVDRGYFVRNGAIDRCNNPRPLHGAVRRRHVRNA